MGSSKKQVIGYKYYLGIHMVMCHGPIDKVTQIRCDDKLAWKGTSTGGMITVNAPNLFGGEDREGGVSGIVDFQFGGSTQAQDSYLSGLLGSDVPAYRGVASAILKHTYVGMSPYIKAWAFRGTRIMTGADGGAQWYSRKAAIGDDMNPAHILYECLTSKTWGMGYEAGDIDEASFIAAADALYTEGLGMSILWDRQKELQDFINVITDHISGALYVSKDTGKFTLKLIREDYTIGDLPVFDESNISSIKDFTRPLVGELINTVTVIFWDSDTGKESSVTVQDIALLASQGTSIGTTIQYPGFSNGDNAVYAASRDLQALSTPLFTCTLTLTRAGSELSIGDPFVLSWDDYGIESVVMRVTEMKFGGINNSQIVISAVQDIFSVSDAVMVPPPVTDWISPATEPQAVTEYDYFEAGYWDILFFDSKATADAVAYGSGYLGITAKAPSSDSYYATLYVKGPSGYESKGRLEFAPYTTLAQPMVETDTELYFTSLYDYTYAIGKYIRVGDECMVIDTVDTVNSKFTVGRGVLDTLPQRHATSTPVYFPGVESATSNTLYATGSNISAKLCTVTMQGTLDLDDAPVMSQSVFGRAALPYPPARFKINGVFFGTTASAAAGLTLAWVHRDRTLQISETLYDQLDNSIGPEAGVTYTAQLRTTGGTLISKQTGLTGQSTLFDTATITPYIGRDIRVQLWSVRSGLDSWQKYDHTVSITS
jgi:hypothetical protein